MPKIKAKTIIFDTKWMILEVKWSHQIIVKNLTNTVYLQGQIYIQFKLRYPYRNVSHAYIIYQVSRQEITAQKPKC